MMKIRLKLDVVGYISAVLFEILCVRIEDKFRFKRKEYKAFYANCSIAF